MNFSREQTAEMAEVMAAFGEGKEVQFRRNGTTQWNDTPEPAWHWPVGEYRVKPRPPRDFWTIENSRGVMYSPDMDEDEVRRKFVDLQKTGDYRPYKLIHLREVLDD